MSSPHSANSLSGILTELFEEKVDRFTLPNGLTVLFKQSQKSQLVSTQVWVKTGSIHENNYLGAGLSHFLEHMLFKGTQSRTGKEISCHIENVGGHFNAYTTFDRTVYYVDLPSEEIALALDVLSDMVFNSLLLEEEVEKERGVILREIDMYIDDPSSQISDALFYNAFRSHPYRHPIIGYRNLFEAVIQKELLQYYNEKYVPNNIVLVIAGDAENQTVRDLAKRYFAPYPRQFSPPSLILEEPEQLAPRREELIGDIQICRGSLGFKVPAFSHPDTPLLDILASILGNGDSAILWQKLREERQLVHSIEVSNWNPGTIGLFCISYCCDPSKRDAVEEAIVEEIQAIFEKGIEEQRIAKAVRQAIVMEINMRKTVSGEASRQGFCEVVLGDLGAPKCYFERIQSITAEELSTVMKKYLITRQMTAVSLNAPSGKPSIKKRPKDKKGGNTTFETIILKNGLRLMMQHDPSLPKVHLRASFCGGPLYEAPTYRGITALMATLMTGDTHQHTANEVAEKIESIGASLDEFYGNDIFGLTTEVLPQDFSIGLECLTQALLEPDFKEDRLDLERRNLIDQIKENEDEIVYYGMVRLRQIFFGDHPYNTIPEGNETCLNTIGIHTVKKHYQTLVNASNGVVAIAGDFDPGTDINRLKESLENFPTLDCHANNISFERPPHPGLHEVSLQREQVVVFQAYPGTGLKDNDFIVGEVLEEIFSEMSGHLFTQIREERSLAYFVSASRISGWDAGMFFLYAGTNPKTYDEVFTQMDLEIQRIQTGGLTQEELSRALSCLKSRRRMNLQTLRTRATLASNYLLSGLPLDLLKNYDQRIETVTLERIQNFAQKYFQQEKKVALIVKP